MQGSFAGRVASCQASELTRLRLRGAAANLKTKFVPVSYIRCFFGAYYREPL